MSEPGASELGFVTARGTPRQIGRALGEAGREAVHKVLLHESYWRAVTDPVHAGTVGMMADILKALFPPVWEELQGLAEGLGLPPELVMAWNCRGDLMSNVPDGCTTVQIPGGIGVIGHNEDGLPGFRGHAFVAEIAPDDGPAFMASCYPGSIPGHTFGANAAGMAQAVNNLRLHPVAAHLPRMGLSRAVLACETLDDALALVAAHNDCGGFHMTLAQAGDARMMSVEFGGGACSARQIETPAAHANHALHLGERAANQIVTDSSRDRQARATQMIADGITDPFSILRDTGGAGLPIHRCAPDDPDHENTLATALFRIEKSSVEWRLYDQTSKRPVIEGRWPRPQGGRRATAEPAGFA